jgi:hypothetical protein
MYGNADSGGKAEVEKTRHSEFDEAETIVTTNTVAELSVPLAVVADRRGGILRMAAPSLHDVRHALGRP